MATMASTVIVGTFKGAGGVPGGPTMENEFECPGYRGDHGGHFAEEFVKKYRSWPELS